MELVPRDRVRLLPQGVILHFSHVKGGSQKGSGRKPGFCGGEGSRGDHGVDFRPSRAHGNDKCGLSSLESASMAGFGSTSLYFFYAVEKPGPEGSPLRFLDGLVTDSTFLRSEGRCGGSRSRTEVLYKYCMPDLSGAQLRAALRLALGSIGLNFAFKVGSIIPTYSRRLPRSVGLGMVFKVGSSASLGSRRFPRQARLRRPYRHVAGAGAVASGTGPYAAPSRESVGRPAEEPNTPEGRRAGKRPRPVGTAQGAWLITWVTTAQCTHTRSDPLCSRRSLPAVNVPEWRKYSFDYLSKVTIDLFVGIIAPRFLRGRGGCGLRSKRVCNRKQYRKIHHGGLGRGGNRFHASWGRGVDVNSRRRGGPLWWTVPGWIS